MELCVMCHEVIPRPKRGPIGTTCSGNCRKRLSRKLKPVTPLATISKTCDTPATTPYTASSIAILSDSDRKSNPMFDWELAEDLAHEIIRPVVWIKRGILACRESGVSPQYFIDRYLYRRDIPMNKHVDLCFRKILDKAQL